MPIDPQDLLPAELRDRWAVVPRHELYQAVAAGFLLGAGGMSTIVGSTIGPGYLGYGFPLAVLVCYLQAKLLGKISDRRVTELTEGTREGTQETHPAG